MWVQPIVDAISLAAALWFYRAIQRGSAAGGTAQPGPETGVSKTEL